MYDFSKMTNRFNTNSYKWDVKENELPMWVNIGHNQNSIIR